MNSKLAYDQDDPKVLVLFTGGTIGMMRNNEGVLGPIPNKLEQTIRQYPNMHDEKYATEYYGDSPQTTPLVLPSTQDPSRRVHYTIKEYEVLLDSSNMTMEHWAIIAKDIEESYKFYHGFVILHGTDTLAYTASALSFMLENLGKTVIVTGSQIPIFETRSDGKDNFISALILAGNYVIPEVGVFFCNQLLRGSRTAKISCDALNAFASQNVPPLVKVGIDIHVDYRCLHRPCNIEPFKVHLNMERDVVLIRFFPGMPANAFRAALQPPTLGVVLQSYGSGNVPSNRNDLMDALMEASERGVIIVNCTQCPNGSVATIYDTGKVLADIGVLPGFDMTPEAALTKLCYVLGKTEWTSEQKKLMMQSNLRGELTAHTAPNIEESDLIDAVGRSLNLSAPQELDKLGATLFPAMINAAVLEGDVGKLHNLISYGANLSSVNHDDRSALHLACKLNKIEIVRLLLDKGVSVHQNDRDGRTPLIAAISSNNHDIIKLLIKCGAHLTGKPAVLGNRLCTAAAIGSLKAIQSYQYARVKLSTADHSGRTALHLAALHGFKELVIYLLKYIDTDDIDRKDMLGLTAVDYAQSVGQTEISNIITSRHT